MAETMETQYLTVKQALLKQEFSHMNPMQQEAVFHVNGPVLILAGAGSGKTTVLVNRIANMVHYGNAYESREIPAKLTQDDLSTLQTYLEETNAGELAASPLRSLIAVQPVRPWNILAITFTNKAAGELKDRLLALLGEDAREIQASTFHSACMRILRREIPRLGYNSNFTVYDSDDSVRIIKEALKELNIQEKTMAPKAILASISTQKDRFVTAEELLASAAGDFRTEITAKVYAFYQKRLKAANALDFDDIIILTVKIFLQFPDVLEHYQNRFRYIMVDEYQDTNNSQYLLVSLLSKTHKNICVVGDDDQSIYKFRGATIENIMNFEKQYQHAKVIRLEQNYRCTQTILEAANAVIGHNEKRKGKTLWTQNQKGNLIKIYRGMDEQDEARFIAETILDNVKAGKSFSSHAILYRMNAQSNTIENALIRSGITYRILGGQRFYDRKEIKDIISYMSLINNRQDTVRLKRIINEPKRGIGDATLDKAQDEAAKNQLTLFEVLQNAEKFENLAKKAKVLHEFTDMIERLAKLAQTEPLGDLFDELIRSTKYLEYLRAMGDEGKSRIENVQELKTNVLKYANRVPVLAEEEESTLSGLEKPTLSGLEKPTLSGLEKPTLSGLEKPTLSGFLEEVTLYTDLDNYDPEADNVVMMTMHSAKGLEFDNVFFCGAEEGIFPGMQAMYNPDQIEEERRLAYVCITRAKEQLYVTNSAQRMIFGQTVRNRISRFAAEIPASCCDVEDKTIRRRVAQPTDPITPVKKFRSRASNEIGVGSSGQSAAENEKAGVCNLEIGDRVSHRTFGEGMIVNVSPMGGDYFLEVAFDTVGTKKIMFKFAKLKKI